MKKYRIRPMQGEVFQKVYAKPNRYKRHKRITRHHNKAKSLGGSYDHWNIYKLSVEHHQAYHKLFGLRTFTEASEVLLRMQEIHKFTE